MLLLTAALRPGFRRVAGFVTVGALLYGIAAAAPAAAQALPDWFTAPLGGEAENTALADPTVSDSATSLPGAAAGIIGDRLSAIDCLAKAIGYEAANEPLAGRQAVAQVILNRSHHKAFPKTVCGVVFQGSERRTGCQFTFTCDGSMRRALSPRTWLQALEVARQAVEGRLPATVGAATHYHAGYVSPRWAPSLVKVATIGAHIFYRFPGPAGSVGVYGGTGGGAAPESPATSDGPGFSPWGLSPAKVPDTRF